MIQMVSPGLSLGLKLLNGLKGLDTSFQGPCIIRAAFMIHSGILYSFSTWKLIFFFFLLLYNRDKLIYAAETTTEMNIIKTEKYLP